MNAVMIMIMRTHMDTDTIMHMDAHMINDLNTIATVPVRTWI